MQNNSEWFIYMLSEMVNLFVNFLDWEFFIIYQDVKTDNSRRINVKLVYFVKVMTLSPVRMVQFLKTSYIINRKIIYKNYSEK